MLSQGILTILLRNYYQSRYAARAFEAVSAFSAFPSLGVLISGHLLPFPFFLCRATLVPALACLLLLASTRTAYLVPRCIG